MMRSCLVTRSLNVVVAFLSLGSFASLAGAQNSPTLQLNVPYRCPDGTVMVATRCEMKSGTEVCVLQRSANGKALGEISMPKAQAAAVALVCPLQGAAAPQAPSNEPPAAKPATQPPTQQAERTGPPDPSIAKARAAHVDTKVLGIQLGEPLQIPRCTSLFGTETTCVQNLSGLEKALGVDDDAGNRQHTSPLELSQDACPSWSKDCTGAVMTYDGRVVAVSIGTKGHIVDAAVAQDLRAKYGPPTSAKPITVTPRVGNPFRATTLEWFLPGLHVIYEVAQKGENEGEIINTEQGSIGVETEAAYQRRVAAEKAKPRPSL
jgi:hypothetical protein